MKEEITIRMAKIQEARILAEIEKICFPPQEAAAFEQIEERMIAFPENFVVAEAEGKPVGFINGGTTDRPYLPDEMYHDVSLHIPGGDYQTVFGLNVLPDYRHQGIAGKLLDYFTELAQKRGKKGVILTCKERLIGFYENHGFRCFGLADSSHGGARWYDMRNMF